MKFIWIHEHRKTFAIDLLCEVLEVSKSGYYAWRKRPVSERKRRRERLGTRITEVHRGSRGVYGSPRVHRELIAGGEQVCRNTVAKIMRDERIRSVTAKRFVPRTTDSSHPHPVAQNLLGRAFAAGSPDRKWCADITYIQTREGTLYLAAVIDLCNRQIVGWSMSERMPAELVSEALRMALARRQPAPGLLHHSDRGVQYACSAYQEMLSRHGIVCSMSRVGNCYDNAVMESFWGTLKTECVYPHGPYASHAEARRSVFEYIEVFYNRVRRHSSLGYLSPEAFEAASN